MRHASLSLCALVALGVATSLPNIGKAELLAGAAKRSIVPDHPTRMGGFADRTAKFTGVKTPIFARALVVDNGQKKIAVVTNDLIGVSEELVRAAREAIRDRVGIPAENVLISASHTHSGPSGYYKGRPGMEEPYDAKLFQFLVNQITDATAEAFQNRKAATLGFAYGRLDTITSNRQQGNTTVIDPDVGVLRVNDAKTKKPIAILFNFTGHPVVLSSDNLEISGEYPGMAAQTVEDVLGGVALFTQGACGDVTMRRNAQSFSEVQRLGRILAGEIIKTAEMIAPTENTTLASSTISVQLRPRQIPALQDAEAAQTAAQEALTRAKADQTVPANRLQRLERKVSDARMNVRLAKLVKEHPDLLKKSIDGSAHIVQIGPLVLVAVPAELFVEYALEMKQRVRQMKDRPMVLVGYADGLLGYVITPRAKITGGYEQSVTRLDETAGRTLTEAAMERVEEVVK
jgi:hypothetical protein